MNARSRLLVLALAAAAATPALAAGPSREVVQERLYDFDGRFDLALLGGVSTNNKLTNQFGAFLQPAYHFTDAWAFELTLGYVMGAEKSALTRDIRNQISAEDELSSEFSDMGTMSWLAHGSVRWSPVYGKLSLASELPLHFGAFLSVGGGMVGVTERSFVDCAPDGAGDFTCAEVSEARPSVGVGAGLRIFMGENMAVRLEMKDFIFPDRYTLYADDPAKRQDVDGLSTVLMFMAGVSYAF